tara:strand:- start:893 stop:1249 length:357 start_codon:yes stop_codon:yes gene_type:complete
MPIAEIVADNIGANSTVNQLNGNRVEFINPNIRGAVVRLLAVASAVDLEHEMFIGDRNPLVRSEVSVSATPNNLLDPDNIVMGGAGARPSERLILNTIEIGGVATNDYRARVIIRELN